MKIKSVLHIISFLVGVVALAMFPAALISFWYNEPQSAISLLFSAGVSLVFAFVCGFFTRGKITLSTRDGFGVAAFGWVFVSLFGALPYLFSGVIDGFIPAVFETMSGFTTTGASVLTGLEELPRGILFWRAMTHFFGGMGVLVLCVAILPFLAVGGVQIYRAEIPGPDKDRLTPRIASTAKLLWIAYLSFCLLQTILLLAGGMSLLDAWCHTCATMATGGFSTRTASISAYNSLYIEIVIIFFMFMAGTNFALHLRMFSRKNPLEYFKDGEFRFYFILWSGACFFLAFNIWGQNYSSFFDALRAAFFQGTSIMTTTGFVTEDFNLWPHFSRTLLLVLMFVGGCGGSTGGGVKNIRILVAGKALVRELSVYMRPNTVKSIKYNQRTVKGRTAMHMAIFLLAFVLIFIAGSLVMTFFTPDLITAASSTIACLGNIGPGLNAVGAVENYAAIPNAGKLVLTLLMLFGRLELFTVLVIFLPDFWKK